MAVPKCEQIEAEILTRLSAISTPTSNYDYKEVSRKLRAPEMVNSHPVLFVPPGRVEGSQPVQYADRVLRQAVWGYHDLKNYPGTQLNLIWQDVERALFPAADTTHLGLDWIVEATVSDVDKWQSMEDDQEIIRLLVEFHFTYDRGDP